MNHHYLERRFDRHATRSDIHATLLDANVSNQDHIDLIHDLASNCIIVLVRREEDSDDDAACFVSKLPPTNEPLTLNQLDQKIKPSC